MKKLLSSFTIILIILLILWAVLSGYYATKTEQEFKSLLKRSSQLVGKRLFRVELLSYKKTVSGAKAKLSIGSDYPALSERMGELEMNVKLLNGPFFITPSGVSIGSSHWVLQVVDGGSGVIDGVGDKIYKHEDFFPRGLPSATVRVDFERKAHYVVKGETDIAQSLITGVFDLITEDNRGAITMNKFNFGVLPNMVSADVINISYQHQKAITTRYKPGTASLQATSLKISHKALAESLVLDVKMNSDLYLDENILNGFLKTAVRNVGVKQFPIEKAEMSLLFKGLPADAFITFSEANDELDNLHQQAQWALEELGEVPEGQDQIWSLYDRIEESSKIFPKLLAGQLSANGENLIQLKATTYYKNMSSHLTGNIKLESENVKISSWLSLLNGEAQVELDQFLFEFIETILPITTPKFKLFLKKNKVLMLKE
ncbi:MAG: YdgA family protein [Methylococcaceae bacterium]|nr:YdgA family protein [Methylococcaceae bacterium]